MRIGAADLQSRTRRGMAIFDPPIATTAAL
jgi:hypothetical protein